jgi:small subunit ribosomal protein S13
VGDKKAKVKDDAAEKKADKSKDKKMPEKKIVKSIEGVRGMVRLANMNLDGTKKVRNAIMGINGIGQSLSGSIVTVSGVDPNVMLGTLTDEQVGKLEDAMRNPSKYGIPSHMLNRRSDPATGEDKHLISSDLSFNVRGDIDFMKKIRCYKGIRHELGQPVRGQRTRSTFRTGMQMGFPKRRPSPVQRPPRQQSSSPGSRSKTGSRSSSPGGEGAPAAAAPAKTDAKKK